MNRTRESNPPFRLRSTAPWILFALFLLTLVVATNVVMTLFVAVLFAVAISGLSEQLSRRTPLKRGWALAAVLFGLVALAAGLIWVIAPQVSTQVAELRQTLPQSIQHLIDSMEKTSWGSWLLAQIPTPDSIAGQDGAAGALLARVGSIFSSTFAILSNIALTLIIGLFLAVEPGLYRAGVVQLFPRAKRRRAQEILRTLASTIRWWLVGQLGSMTFLGVFSFLGLWILGIPLALTLALFTAVMTFIPNFGAMVSLIPPIMLALMDSPTKALYVFVFYLLLQVVEGNFVTPMIQRSAVKLPPALLITGQLLLAVLLGFWGLLLAAPIVAVTMVLVKELYLRDTLGDEPESPAERQAA